LVQRRSNGKDAAHGEEDTIKRRRGRCASSPPSSPGRPFTRILSRKELLAILPGGITYPTVFEWVPAPVELGSGGRIGWKDNEVYDALDKLPRRYPKGSKKPEGES
jgi:hypothetical protein